MGIAIALRTSRDVDRIATASAASAASASQPPRKVTIAPMTSVATSM